jgi:hypothetical protein
MHRLHDLLVELSFPAVPIEWTFSEDDDGLWQRECGHNGHAISRSGEHFRTQQHCMRDVIENGLCSFFSPREIWESTDHATRAPHATGLI